MRTSFILALALVLLVCAPAAADADAVAPATSSSTWDRIGPHNIFNAYSDGGQGPLPMGEAGTLAGASSLAAKPEIIYAGGQNNGVSSGVIKTVDGGRHWVRASKGMWDTRVLGVWIHPDDKTANHVFAGTHSGIYETTDGAATWTLREETAAWGGVMSFREGNIQVCMCCVCVRVDPPVDPRVQFCVDPRVYVCTRERVYVCTCARV